MAKIKALRPEVFNLIAAGEVVEAPVNAVKELVENSIDAGAKRITIDVLGGGLDQITVTDSGCGIAEEDVELAFAKYATSKLETASDLDAIMTLGFRGEALSSIAAVSRIKLTTRTNEMDTGVCVTVENGVVTNKQYVSANVGTKIEVRDLYYNVPVRKNFLKNAAGEKAVVTKFVAKLILTNPNLAITYSADGKTVYDSNGNGLDAAIFAVYGEECLSNCIPINYTKGDLRIQGYIGTPEYSKPNKNYQTLAVNGRCVTDANVAGAIAQAYSETLMKHKFPFYVLNLEIPADAVEVNIHPTKSVVRFANSRHISGQFYYAVQNGLENYRVAHSEEIFSTFSTRSVGETPRYTPKDVEATIAKLENDGVIEQMNPAQRSDVWDIERLTDDVDKERRFNEFAAKIQREVSVEKARQKLGFDPMPAVEQEVSVITEEPVPPIREYDEGEELYDRSRVLGIAFRTYLIIELDDKIIFIDQHAAHERILFDKFMQSASLDMQQLAVPYPFTVNPDEAVFIKDNAENILAAGFEIKPFGPNTFRITAVSSLLIDTPMLDFVEFLLGSIDEFKLDDRKLIVEAIAKKACKAAVKAGQKLNEYEIEYILKQVYDNKILQCPHGRPITVVYTKTQFEKLFKRIV